MKTGLKIRKNNLHLIDKFSDIFDFFEIYIDRRFPLEKLRPYIGKNITIHAAHNDDKFDPSDTKLHSRCQKILSLSVAAANLVSSPWIIVHPGHSKTTCSKKNMITFFEKNWDQRIIFENCPLFALNENPQNNKYLFSLPPEIKFLTEKFKTSFVLDFAHAICTANLLHKDPKKIIRDFLSLSPCCFHISGIELDSVTDNHENLFTTRNKMKYLRLITDGNKYFTFEVHPQTIKNKKIQKKNLSFFRSIFTAP